MASESPVSHNPFRRRSSAAAPSLAPAASSAAPPPEAPARPPAAGFRSPGDFAKALEALPKSDGPPPSTTFQKKKPVKKVRVQSPPPSSPESTGAPRTYPKYPLPPRDDDESSSVTSDSVNGEREDPFQNEAPPFPHGVFGQPGGVMEPLQVQPQAQQPYAARGPPPNPFYKTLEDMELAARGEDKTSSAKTGLDVETFKNLLLTGQGPPPGAGGPPAASGAGAGDESSMTETSSVSRQSISENTVALQDTPRTSHEISEPEGDEEKRGLLPTTLPKRSASRKKPPPPPPATRHGKLIKTDVPPGLDRRSSGGAERASPTSPRLNSPTSPTDVNKPLPPPPERFEDDAKDSIFDQEAAGKLPEIDIDPEANVVPPPRPPTPPNASHSSSTPVPNPVSTQWKPAPPPRRHSNPRSESKTSADVPEDHEAAPRRPSLESSRSRSSSIRLSISAPAPPPPRRASGHHRNSSTTSPAQASPSYSFPSPVSDVQQGDAKFSPPAPPPQRNTSLRSKGASRAKPPPPPPRARGSSKGSIDGPGLSRTRSTESVYKSSDVASVAEEAEVMDTSASDEAMRAMLADLDALQREVDAARAAAGGG